MQVFDRALANEFISPSLPRFRACLLVQEFIKLGLSRLAENMPIGLVPTHATRSGNHGAVESG